MRNKLRGGDTKLTVFWNFLARFSRWEWKCIEVWRCDRCEWQTWWLHCYCLNCGFCSVLKTKENDVSSVSVMMIETQELAVISGPVEHAWHASPRWNQSNLNTDNINTTLPPVNECWLLSSSGMNYYLLSTTVLSAFEVKLILPKRSEFLRSQSAY